MKQLKKYIQGLDFEYAISGILHICFQCYQMRNELAEDMIVGTEVFQKIAIELIKDGHPIENK